MKQTLKYTFVILASLILILSFMPPTKVSALAVPKNGDVVIIKNRYSGKCLNVNFGTDANGTNVNQWTQDGSIEQEWRLVQDSNGKWKIYTMCSSNGTNRVLDVLRTGGSSNGSIVSGCNVDIWSPNDPAAQEWIIWSPEKDGYYIIQLASSAEPLVLTAYGTLNGSGAGTSPTSAGNVYLSEPIGISGTPNSQYWEFIKLY